MSLKKTSAIFALCSALLLGCQKSPEALFQNQLDTEVERLGEIHKKYEAGAQEVEATANLFHKTGQNPAARVHPALVQMHRQTPTYFNMVLDNKRELESLQRDLGALALDYKAGKFQYEEGLRRFQELKNRRTKLALESNLEAAMNNIKRTYLLVDSIRQILPPPPPDSLNPFAPRKKVFDVNPF